MEKEIIISKLSKIFSEVLEEKITLDNLDANLVDDIGLDSMGFLEVSVMIQREFDISMPSEDWENVKTVSDLLTTIERKISENEKK